MINQSLDNYDNESHEKFHQKNEEKLPLNFAVFENA